MAKVAPEPESEDQSEKSAKGSNIGFENPELSSAITGRVIGPNDTLNTLQLPDTNQRIKNSHASSLRSHKRLPRSVSEVVEEKEKQEKNVITRFANKYRRHGFCGLFIAIADEVDIFKCRCKSCFETIIRYLTCKQRIEEED